MRYLAYLGIFLFCGCTATYQRIDLNENPPSTLLKSEQGVLISVPTDGSYGTTLYRQSGKMTARATLAAFARHTNKIEISNDCKSQTSCLKEALGKELSYFIEPEILHWEERATEWSGKPDRIEIKLTIYDVKTGHIVNSTILKGKSKWATFGGDHPQDLLHEPLNDYISFLY